MATICGTFQSLTRHEGTDEEKIQHCSTLSITWTLDGVSGQRHAPSALPLGFARYQLRKRLGRPQGQSGRVRKYSPSSGFDLRAVQVVEYRYTDLASPTHTQHP